MIKYLQIKNSYIPDRKIVFQQGLNVISGKNGIGKSAILEYLNFALFGTPALRSPIKTFSPDFFVKVAIVLEGDEYIVTRTPKTAQITDSSGEILVSGVAPVNTRLKELLGYDYHVHTLISFCKQHDLLSLTNSTPMQLLTLIEDVSGLSSSYKLEQTLKEQRKEVGMQEQALRSSVNVALRSLENSFIFNEEYEELLKQENPLTSMREAISAILIEKDKVTRELATAEEVIKSHRDLQATYHKLLKKYKDEDLETWQKTLVHASTRETALRGLRNLVESLTPTEVSEEELLRQEVLHADYARWEQEEAIKKRLGEVECPNCHHKFYNTALEFSEAPEAPFLTLQQIREGKKWHKKKAEYYSALEQIKELEGEPSLSIKEIKDTIAGITELAYVKRELEKLPPLPASPDALKAKVAELEETYIQLDKERDAFSKYITERLEYEKKEALRETYGEQLDATQKKKDLYNLLLETLKDVKGKVQTTILPKLNYTASNILSEVTYGMRSSIEITEDFKILVDGNSVDVLEGSAQVFVNVAIRCALLLTFYSNTFLVSIQDETDAPLSADRFEALVEAYRSLEGMGFQLIVVSHKDWPYGYLHNLT